jgi:alanine racemase
LFPAGSAFYDDTNKFLQWLAKTRFENQLILVKGARAFSFEKIVQALLRKHHGTVLEINLDALAHNLNFFRKQLPAGTRVMVMVKAFAYGTGSHEVANLLQYHGVDYLGVAYADEGVDLRKHGIQTPIMVMNTSPDNFDQLVDYNLETEIYSQEILKALQEFCRNKGVRHKIHIKLDTGMHRLGIEPSEIPAFLTQWKEYPLPVASVFSHLAAADNPEHNDFTRQQYHTFATSSQELERVTGGTFLRHILNSSGILQFPDYHLDMVRLGIGLYGVGPKSELKSISKLITTVSQIKNLKKGETVGYDRSGKLTSKSKIATIAIGYADGYDRRFGNGVGKVLVGDKRVPVVGNICMDMTMIDVTGCEVEVGDQVIIFNDRHPIEELAENIGTIPYELLTKISERVKRVYYLE